jgi:F-box protein, helicase, 18
VRPNYQDLFAAPEAENKPTQEQEHIIGCRLHKGQSIMVEAGAGTGKTFTLIEKARRLPPKARALYICFSNKAAAEARQKLSREAINNTRACTVHALAGEKKKMLERAGKFQTKITVKDIQKHGGPQGPGAWWVLETINAFCQSDKDQILSEHVPRPTGRETPTQLEATRREAQKTWENMANPNHPAPASYDHYLKMFAMEKPMLGYDYIFLDEAQDSNPLTLALVKTQTPFTRTILIGDSRQAIYGWRGAHNAMESWQPTFQLPLRESFRFGKQIAQCANVLLDCFFPGSKPIRGHSKVDAVGPIDPKTKHTLIARTNACLFEQALGMLEQGKTYHFVGTSSHEGWNPTNAYRLSDALDVHHLWRGDKTRVRNPHIKAFDNYAELEKAAAGQGGKGDKELESLCRIVKKHKNRLPERIAAIISQAKGPKEADILLVTAHRAKGLEWPLVRLADDFTDLVIEGDPTKGQTPGRRLATPEEDCETEEINLLYVALTRACQRVEPNPKTLTLFKTKALLPPDTQPPEITPWEPATPKIHQKDPTQEKTPGDHTKTTPAIAL